MWFVLVTKETCDDILFCGHRSLPKSKAFSDHNQNWLKVKKTSQSLFDDEEQEDGDEDVDEDGWVNGKTFSFKCLMSLR